MIVSLVFSHLGFWSGNLFLIAPFPDLCLLVPFYHFSWLGPEFLVCCLAHRGPTAFAPELVGYSAPRDLHRRAAYSVCESWFLIHQDVNRDLFVCS